MTYPTNAEIDEAVPVAGIPDRGLTNAVLKSMVSSLPIGTTRQIARFAAVGGELVAGPFTANLWSDFPGGAPTTGVWVAAFIPGAPEELGFVRADQFASENTVVLRTVENGPFTAGRVKATPAMDPDDCVTKVQIDTMVAAAQADFTDPDMGQLPAAFNALLGKLRASGLMAT